MSPLELNEQLREQAFALLLTRARPVSPDELVHAAGASDVDSTLRVLHDTGWIDRDVDGRVTGSAGLSLTDGPHQLDMDGRAFRTWCAYDAIGIPAALASSAVLHTTCGECGKAIDLEIIDGRPSRTGPERLWLAAGGGDLRTSFCTPTVLLCGAQHGSAWSSAHNGDGELLALDEASRRGANEWAGPANAVRQLGTEVEYVGGPRDSIRERRAKTPEQLSDDEGMYRRSVRCVDDGALRYVWQANTDLTPN